MGMLAGLLMFVAGIAGIVSLVCFVLVVIQMFKNNQTGLGIATIVLLFCGIGQLLALVMAWVKSAEWNLRKVAMIYTASMVVGIVCWGAGYGMLIATMLPELQKQMEMQQNQQFNDPNFGNGPQIELPQTSPPSNN